MFKRFENKRTIPMMELMLSLMLSALTTHIAYTAEDPSPTPEASASPASSPAVSTTDPSPSPLVSLVKEGPGGLKAQLSATEVVDGSVLLVTIHAPEKTKASEVTVSYNGKVFQAFPVEEENSKESVFRSVVGVAFGTKMGQSSLQVEWSAPGTSRVVHKLKMPFQVIDGNYRAEVLKVDPRHVNPKKRDLRRIRKEVAEVGEIYRMITQKKYWEGPFALPIDSPITSPFGTKRVFNGEMKSFHQGLDLKAAIGAPINAAANGVIVMAKDLFFTGNTVLIDHGFGIFTLYAHLSKLKVKKGQKVSKGDLLGLAGMTGRASGPHLHWGAIINRAKVNPMDLVRVMK